MAWEFHSNSPIYTQVITELKKQIVVGSLKPGEKIPSVRDLAKNAGVNPNTVQRAVSELEREQLLFAQRTSGRFVTNDISLIEEKRKEMALEMITEFINSMQAIGYSKEELQKFISQYYEQK
jgi:transcriptional regulator, gntR family